MRMVAAVQVVITASDLVDDLVKLCRMENIGLNKDGELVSPLGSLGYRWGEKGKWNLEQKSGSTGKDIDLTLSLKSDAGEQEVCDVTFDYFGHTEHPYFTAVAGEALQAGLIAVKPLLWRMVVRPK